MGPSETETTGPGDTVTTGPGEAAWSLHPGAACREIGGEFFVVTGDRAFHHIHVPTAIDIFGALKAGPRTSAQLVALLCESYDVDAARAARDVRGFLELLVQRQLATRVSEEHVGGEGARRRDG